jgi:hypothetical protein
MNEARVLNESTMVRLWIEVRVGRARTVKFG